jgi:hypothetical protein
VASGAGEGGLLGEARQKSQPDVPGATLGGGVFARFVVRCSNMGPNSPAATYGKGVTFQNRSNGRHFFHGSGLPFCALHSTKAR